jgi:hypothetical protein
MKSNSEQLRIVARHGSKATSASLLACDALPVTLAAMPSARDESPDRFTQQIAARHYAFVAPVEGTVIDARSTPTGSWFAHGAADKLWLDRIVIQKDDGEISTLNLDEHSRIERV